MLRNLILDWSGILASDPGLMVKSTNRTFGSSGQAELLLEESRQHLQWPIDTFFAELLPNIGRGELEPLLRGPAQCHQTVDLLPSVLEFLRFCEVTGRRVFLLGAITGPHWEEQATRLGVAHLFERVYLGVADKRGGIADILAENQLAAVETALITDREQDVATARAGGVMSIATLTGFDSPEKLCRAYPDIMVRDLTELQRLLELAPPDDLIRIEALELMARVGVPDLERAEPQRLTVSIILQPGRTFGDLCDDLARTIDYAAVCEDLHDFVAGRADKLIETLAHEMAGRLLERFGLARVELELRKFVLPETRYVAVRVVRGTARTRSRTDANH